MTKEKWKKTNIYKPGTAEYYRDQLGNISAVAVHYDGCNVKSAKQMKELIDDLREIANDALDHKKLYCTCETTKEKKK